MNPKAAPVRHLDAAIAEGQTCFGEVDRSNNEDSAKIQAVDVIDAGFQRRPHSVLRDALSRLEKAEAS